MTPDPTLTDEELAVEIEELIADSPRPTVVLYQNDVLRLITALRDERAKVCNHCGHNPGSCARD